MSSPVYRFVVRQKMDDHPRMMRLLSDAKALGFKHLRRIDYCDIYFIQGKLSEKDQQRLASYLLIDSFRQEGSWEKRETTPSHLQPQDHIIEIALRSGVTDIVAEQIVRGAQLLEVLSVEKVSTGGRFSIQADTVLTDDALHLLAQKLLSNTVIQQYSLGKLNQVFASPLMLHSDTVAIIPIRHLTQEQLILLSQQRRAALDGAEMLAIQKYFIEQQREPTDVEFEMIAQTWSEHCSHKTFKADIKIESNAQMISGLLNTFIRKATEEIAAPWVASAFVDNAGIIDFDEEYQLSFKVETHNHPSAIEPFGGSNTGLGGVIRDILGVSAKPIAATDIFCLGPQTLLPEYLPEGVLHPRLIASGVVAGVEDYGNKTGIPTVNGAIYYDEGYIANPLVFCGCVGIAPRDSHPRHPQAGDRIIILGGRTGRDGLRGATFSSMAMNAQTGEVAGASVQIGDPVTARGLIEVVTRARDAKLYHAITDCGAGGLSSAVGEMASRTGAEVELSHVKLKYQGLTPWEIWLSEAQERMVLAVPPKSLSDLQHLCDIFDVELTDIGHFTQRQELVVYYQQESVLKLSNKFLHDSMPKKVLMAELNPPALRATLSQQVRDRLFARKGGILIAKQGETPSLRAKGAACVAGAGLLDYPSTLLKLLSHPNIASKSAVIRLYDHEVQGATVIKPLTGIQNDGPSDGCVLKPLCTQGLRGIVLSNGLNPELGKHDPYAMAVSVIDEAVRNAVAVGADPARIAILDNFCWGNPNCPETLGTLVEAARGCYTAALHYQTPFISGKDSLNNEYRDRESKSHAIPGTLLISAIGIIPDISDAITMDFKSPGNIIYLLGETQPQFAGSHFNLVCQTTLGNSPTLPGYGPLLYQNLHQTIRAKFVRACHDLSEGGLAVALAEMCIGGRLGCDISLLDLIDSKVLNSHHWVTALFSESNGRLLVEVAPPDCEAFEACFSKESLGWVRKIGTVTEKPVLSIADVITLSVNTLVEAFNSNSSEN